jgi:hypothetical protein
MTAVVSNGTSRSTAIAASSRTENDHTGSDHSAVTPPEPKAGDLVTSPLAIAGRRVQLHSTWTGPAHGAGQPGVIEAPPRGEAFEPGRVWVRWEHSAWAHKPIRYSCGLNATHDLVFAAKVASSGGKWVTGMQQPLPAVAPALVALVNHQRDLVQAKVHISALATSKSAMADAAAAAAASATTAVAAEPAAAAAGAGPAVPTPEQCVPVSHENTKLGLEVVRGRDWRWDDQDGGAGCRGVVVAVESDGSWTDVAWKTSGLENSYRSGAEGAYDLYVAPPLPPLSVDPRQPSG